jgi:2-C-methyl-D-erythritol 2,4-cyclodiphosphate synthase
MRIGFGYDVHKLVKGRKLIMGGVDIPYAKGLLGWSDGDVLLHAVIDAIIGAMGEGDIGKHFPAGHVAYKDVSSLKLLKAVKRIMAGRGFSLINIDSTIVAEEPTFAPHINKIRKTIARSLGMQDSRVNVKAKTEEKLGFTGSKKGIKAYAVCLIEKK